MKFELFCLTGPKTLMLDKKTLRMHKKVMIINGLSDGYFNIWIEGNMTHPETLYGTLLKGNASFQEAFTIMENYNDYIL